MKGLFSAAGPEGLAGQVTTALVAAADQPQHAPWPHRHVSREAGLIKLVLALGVLVAFGAVAAVKAWRAWRRRAGGRASRAEPRRAGSRQRGRAR